MINAAIIFIVFAASFMAGLSIYKYVSKQNLIDEIVKTRELIRIHLSLNSNQKGYAYNSLNEKLDILLAKQKYQNGGK